ncbi:MAG: hypothetical protein AAB074_13335 [Planctomycetota bacterium]
MRTPLSTCAVHPFALSPFAEPLDDGKDRSAEFAKSLESAVKGTRDSRAALRKELVLPTQKISSCACPAKTRKERGRRQMTGTAV